MKLVVGLGNPGKEYINTRHNMGFLVIDEICKNQNVTLDKKKFSGEYTKCKIDNEDIILLKPMTYMNLSGKSVNECAEFYKIKHEDIIIIYDDIDIPITEVKIKKKGSAGSHNGMKSVIEIIGTSEFPRVRVGIGTPEYKNDLINYVIGKVQEEEFKTLRLGVMKAKDAVYYIIEKGIDNAMNSINQKGAIKDNGN